MPLLFLDLLFLGVLWLAGYALIALVDHARACDELERMTLAFPVGAAGIGAVLYTLNIAGLPFTRPLVLAVLAGSGLLGLAYLAPRVRGTADILRPLSGLAHRMGPLSLIAILVAAYVFAGHITAAAYTVDPLGDTRVQHFPYAAILFRTHHQPAYSTLAPGENFSVPPAMFVVYAVQWAFLGHIEQILPNFLPVPLLLAWCLLSGLAVRRVLKSSHDAAAFAILLTAGFYNELPLLVGGENVDLPFMVLAAAAAYLVARDIGEDSWHRLPVAILVASLSIWVKLHGLPFVVCLALAMALCRRSGTSALRPAMVFLAGAFGLLAPWYIHNAVAFGNPLFPVATRWLGGHLVTPWITQQILPEWQPSHPFYDFPKMLALSLREPALLLGIPGLWLAFRRRQTAGSFLGCTAIFYLACFMAVLANQTPAPMRFVAPALGILTWLGGAVIDELKTSTVPARVTGVWGVISSLILLPTLWFWAPAISSKDDAVWLHPALNLDSIVKFWWIAPLSLLLFVVSVWRRSAGGLVLCVVPILAVSAVAIQYQKPFVDLGYLRSAGVLRSPNWSASPCPSPTIQWIQQHLGPSDVIYTYYAERWICSASMLAAMDPYCEPIHRKAENLDEALGVLSHMGVEYVLVRSQDRELAPARVYESDVILKHLSDTRRFELIRSDPIMTLYKIIYAPGSGPTHSGAGHPMPWLYGGDAGGPATGVRSPGLHL